MEENIKTDEEYKKAFNLGYELAKELNLKTPMFKSVVPTDDHMNAVQAGMMQYSNELNKNLHKGNVQHQESNVKPQNIASVQSNKNNKDMGKGLDFSN